MKIDFVVTWVDSSDEEWQKEYSKYRPITPKEDASRYRDWDIFRFWFRAVEKYAPWVNRIFLVTCGQCPEWLNMDNPKIVLVKHSDYIPGEFLPTFNSRCIELNMGRIRELSEHFVYFNDDVFLNAPIEQSYYFTKELPNDSPMEGMGAVTRYTPKDKFGIAISDFCNVAVLNYHFNRWDTVKAAPSKWFGGHLTLKHNFASLMMIGKPYFHGFGINHTEQSYLKSTFDDMWKGEPDFLTKSCTRFREQVSLTPYFARYWQMASNNFYPKRRTASKVFYLNESNLDNIVDALSAEELKSLCINDSPACSAEFFQRASKELYNAFIKKYPNKSSFEK